MKIVENFLPKVIEISKNSLPMIVRKLGKTH